MKLLNPRPTEIKEGEIIQKAFVCDSIKAVDESKRQIDFVISTERVDRMGDIITVAGWQLKEFKNNPVVLFGHASRVPPVARAVKTWKEQTDISRALRSTAEFMPADISAFADSIYKMYLGGYLRAVSVGFMPLEWDMIKDGDGNVTGYKFIKQDLLEFSCVPIPANPDALLEARSKGIDTLPVKDWAEQLLDDWSAQQDPVRLMYDLDRKGLELIRRRAAGSGKSLIIPAHVQDDLLAKNLAAIRKAKEEAIEKSVDDLPEVDSKGCELIVLTAEQTDEGEFTFLETAPQKALVSREFIAEHGTVEGLAVTIKAKDKTATYLATGKAVVGEREALVVELASLENNGPTANEAEATAVAEKDAAEKAAAEKAEAEAAEKAEAEAAEKAEADRLAAEAAEKAANKEVVADKTADVVVKNVAEACDTVEESLLAFEELLEKVAEGSRSKRDIRKLQFLATYMRELAQRLHPVQAAAVTIHSASLGETQDDEVNGEELDKYLEQRLGPKLTSLVQKHLNLLRGRLD